MHARERIIRERLATQTCEGCGQPYVPDSVLILARRQAAWMVLVSCARCDHRGIFVVSFRHAEHAAPDPWRYPDAAAHPPDDTHADPASAPPTLDAFAPAPISPDDVVRMRQFLAHFDGDFRKLFSPPPPPPPPSS